MYVYLKFYLKFDKLVFSYHKVITHNQIVPFQTTFTKYVTHKCFTSVLYYINMFLKPVLVDNEAIALNN